MGLEKDLGAVSAYAIACENGFEGTVEEWLESLIGPMGYQGWSVSAVRATTTGQLIFTVTDPKTGETRELDPVQGDTIDALREIEAAVNDAKKQVEDAANTASASAVKAVEGAQNAGVQAVGDAKTAAVEAITNAQTAGVQAVKDAQTAAINAVSEAQTQATEAVDTAKTQAIQGINAAGQAAVENAQTAITTAKNQAVSDVQAAGQSAVGAVGDAQTEAVEAVETAQANAVQAVQNAGTEEAEKISDILPVPTAEDAGKVPIAKPDGTGYELGMVESGETIDDESISTETTWSSQNIVSRICPPFEVSDSIVTCNPVESSQLNVLVQIEPVQEGEGDPSPENVRPIQGWDSATIWHGGKNLLGEDLPALDGFIDNASDAIVSSTSQGKTYVVPIKKYGTFTVSVNKTQIIRLATCAFKPYLGASLSTITTATSTYRSITSNSSDRYLLVNLPRVDFGADEPMLVYGDSSPYEPYRGETFTIPFGQTVYGGTLDVTTGVLTVTHIEHVEDGSRNFGLSFLPVLVFDFFSEEMKGIFGSRIISNMFGAPNNLVWGSGSARQISLNVTGTPLAELSTNEEFKSYFKGLYDAGNPATFVYELANPVTIQLTPTEIYALSSVNTVYADTGDVTVSGYAEPKTIINALAERIAALEQNAIGG